MKTCGGLIRRAARTPPSALAAALALASLIGAVAVARAQDGSPPNPGVLYERAPDSAAVPAPAVPDAAAPVAAPESPDDGGADTSTIVVPDSMPAPAVVNQTNVIPSATTVVPANGAATPGDGADENQIINYEAQQNPAIIDPQINLQQGFMEEGSETSLIGIEVREAQRKLDDGEVADGLLVVNVVRGSPAARAGLRAYPHIVRNLMEGAAVVAAMAIPPAAMVAMVVVPVISRLRIDDKYDLIIGIDGVRVNNFLDFEDHMRDLQPGEIVYLSIVRNGRRMQLAVLVPNLLRPSGF